jgi:hypothetical protein
MTTSRAKDDCSRLQNSLLLRGIRRKRNADEEPRKRPTGGYNKQPSAAVKVNADLMFGRAADTLGKSCGMIGARPLGREPKVVPAAPKRQFSPIWTRSFFRDGLTGSLDARRTWAPFPGIPRLRDIVRP